MRFLDRYKIINVCDADEAFNFLIDNLKDTIRTYDFFVAWEKVLGNAASVEVSLNILNSLIGKNDILDRLKILIKEYPQIVPTIPLLLAVRDKTINIADIDGDIEYSFKKKKQYSEDEIKQIICFVNKSGFLDILKNKEIKNLVDYYIGVEVGLDTNARKNRSGTSMENLTEVYVNEICSRKRYSYLAQATAKKIKQKFDKEVPTDKANRAFDFAIDTGEKTYLVEVNYYGGGGSKLKSVAGEFKTLYELIKTKKNCEFIWITDGKGWETAKRPLRETFDSTDYVLNLKMVNDGFLEEIINEEKIQ